MEAIFSHSRDPRFDLSLGAAIAGYAFEAYSTPSDTQQDKSVFTSDGTKVILTSQKFAELVFSGVLAVTLESTSLQSGRSVDYGNIGFDLSIEEGASVKTGPGAGFISRQKSNRKNGETLYLFLKDSSAYSAATLQCTAVDYTQLLESTLTMTGSVPFQELLNQGCGRKAIKIALAVHTAGFEQAGTLNATVQLFLLRKNGYGVTDPKIKELFPEMNVNTTTLKPWLTIVNGVLVSEKEDKSAKGKGYGYAEEKNQDDSEGTEYDSSGKSVYKRHRMVGGVLNTPSRTLDLICCVDNAGTGTQASIWANTEHKQIVISFRGTQPGEVKDDIADLKIEPVPYLDSRPDLNIFVHLGFKDCCNSVREALLQIIHLLLTSPDDRNAQQYNWDIVVTGHSLGGALSSLFSFELARIRKDLWGDDNDKAGVYNDDSKGFLTALKAAGLTNYSYGCPRIGNGNFKTTFEALLPNTFRIINSKDVIPRVPLLGWGWQGISLYYGVGRQYQIDKEGGGKEDGYLGYIGKFPIILFNALTFQNIGAHLTPAYKQSFIDAAARFRLTGRN